MLLLLNIFAPTTTDVRVVNYVVPVVSQVRGRVIEVPVENNRPVKKGDVLFKIDPTPYQNAVDSLQARLASEEARVGADRAKLDGDPGEAGGCEHQRAPVDRAIEGSHRAGRVPVGLVAARAETRRPEHRAGVDRRRQPLRSRAGADQRRRAHRPAGSRPRSEQQIREKLSGRVGGDLANVAEVKAQIATAQAQVKVSQAQVDNTRAELATARWELTQTTVRAPGDGTMVNVMLRPGFFVAGMPFNEVMTFVDNEYQIFALFGQNELHQVVPGNEVEIMLDTYPGRIIKAHVDSVIWAQAQGQLDASGDLPRTTLSTPPGRFPVKLLVAEHDRAVFLAAGARGAAAIYTDHLGFLHIIRKVLLRVGSYLNYVIVKHSISLGH